MYSTTVCVGGKWVIIGLKMDTLMLDMRFQIVCVVYYLDSDLDINLIPNAGKYLCNGNTNVMLYYSINVWYIARCIGITNTNSMSI